MVLNTGKCNYMCLGRNTANAVLYLTDKTHANSKEETKFGCKRDNKLSFYSYVKRPLKTSLLYPDLLLLWTLHKKTFFQPFSISIFKRLMTSLLCNGLEIIVKYQRF